MSLRGKVALAISGGKGPAADSVHQLATEGASLALHYNSAKTKDHTLLMRDQLKKKHPAINATVHGGDLATAQTIEQLFNEVLQTYGRIDMVVSTTGTILRKPVSQGTEVDYSKMFAYAVFVDEQRRHWVGRYNDSLQTNVPSLR